MEPIGDREQVRAARRAAIGIALGVSWRTAAGTLLLALLLGAAG